MVLFHTVEASRAALPADAAPRLVALADGRQVTSQVLHGNDLQAAPRSDQPAPLLALHGISRDATALWQAFAPLAAAQGRALLVPRFSGQDWPQFQQIGRSRPDLVLLDLLQQAGLGGERVDLFGFSGGGQLAHRFAMLYPHRVRTLHLAAPGWYTLPDMGAAWPLGLGQKPGGRLRSFDAAALSRLQLRRYLGLKVRLWVGAQDLDRDASLRQTAELDRLQGLTRVDRATSFEKAFSRAARAHGITPDIGLTVLPGCGHDFTDCARKGDLAARVLQGG